MPRPRTGSVEPWGSWPSGAERFRFRLRLGDGSRTKYFDVPEGRDEKQARAYVAALQADEDRNGEFLADKRAMVAADARKRGVGCVGETCDAWHARFLKTREGHVGDVVHARGRWRKWVSPHIGEKPIASVTRDDIEAIRDALDVAIAEFRAHGRARRRAERRLMPKAAQNVWAVVTTAFKLACQAKRATGLRVRDDNPCTNVAPPEKGGSRRKTWIYPTEFLQLVSCEAIAREWRELYAVACYLYLRPGELFELRWRDVDLDSEVVSVSRAWDWDAREVKAPKTANGIRDVPIPSTLMPLLARLREGKSLDEKVMPIMAQTGENKGAALLRVHLELAGVNHPRLTEDTSTRMPIGFRSWRDTGITWAAIDGVDVHKLQRRAGHDDIATTMAYVKEAEDREKLRGRVFPVLPNELVWPSVRPHSEGSGLKNRAAVVPEEGVEHQPSLDVDEHSGTSAIERSSPTPDESEKPRNAQSFGQSRGQSKEREADAPEADPAQSADALEAALAHALDAAALAGRLDDVGRIVEELRVRRLARERNVVDLAPRRRRTGQ